MDTFSSGESHLEPQELISRLLSQTSNAILSTSFSQYSPVLLKLVMDVAPSTPVVWVDTGYNTDETYRFVDEVSDALNLDLHIYHPKRSAAHRQALGQELDPQSSEYKVLVDEVKLEPFRRALRDFNPHYWITGIRREESEFRQSLAVMSAGPGSIKKFAPLFYWTEQDLQLFMSEHTLPSLSHYFDPTKVQPTRECGLHCRL